MARLGFNRSRFKKPVALARGVSILEVLFAILITAIGLMGAISVFPAAMLQARRGQQADATAIAGQAALHAFDAQGLRRADQWLYFNGTQYVSVAGSPYAPTGNYAYCIDPRFIAAQSFSNNTTKGNANFFPAGATGSSMLRVTLPNGLTGGLAGPMSSLLADLHFNIDDDISYNRFRDGVVVRDNTLQAATNFVRDGSNNVLKRESEGHMSWMATLAPKLERIATGAPVEDRYVLSVVVFFDRPSELIADGTYAPSDWAVNINLDSGGINGGEVTLSGTTAEEVTVRNGQWIMLMSQTVIPMNIGHRMPLCRWYRVIDADDPVQVGATYTNAVSLAGGDFTDDLGPNPLRAIICKGVVAVYEKTIKLESRL